MARWEKSTVRLHGEPYLTRWFLCIGGWTLRLHKFHRGDDERAPHDHPWDFWTFPLRPYVEAVYEADLDTGVRLNRVPARRWSFRPAEYRHIVLEPAAGVWTIVVTKPKRRAWGFWPLKSMAPNTPPKRWFVPASEWK
jgi:hypothetical protein